MERLTELGLGGGGGSGASSVENLSREDADSVTSEPYSALDDAKLREIEEIKA